MIMRQLYLVYCIVNEETGIDLHYDQTAYQANIVCNVNITIVFHYTLCKNRQFILIQSYCKHILLIEDGVIKSHFASFLFHVH